MDNNGSGSQITPAYKRYFREEWEKICKQLKKHKHLDRIYLSCKEI